MQNSEKLKKITILLEDIKKTILEISESLEPVAVIPPEPTKTPLESLLESNQWPAAVDPTLICDINSEQDKEDRAEGIVELIIDTHLENLKFLDFGCGEGHVVNRTRKQNTRLSVGYDIVKFDKWDTWQKGQNTFFTKDWSEVKQLGPYDIILMYDVIDHIISTDEQLLNKMKEIKGLLNVNGRIYVRTHPWCSRHATHLYRQINKAYIHMLFSDEQIKNMGYEQEKVRIIKNPIQEYSKLFTEAGFKILSGPNEVKESVESFFISTPVIADKFKELYNGKFPDALDKQFIDYILI